MSRSRPTPPEQAPLKLFSVVIPARDEQESLLDLYLKAMESTGASQAEAA